MSINVNDKNLGHATAYAYYKAGGGTMTEAEFTEFMADFGTASQTAVEAAQAALASKNAAQTAATTATTKASEATTAAQTATTKAGEASTSASTATSAKDTAVSAASTATTKATEATTAAATAVSAKDDAVSANTAAQSAKTAAQTAQTGAETAAASVEASAAQIATNTEDIAQLKSDLVSYLPTERNVELTLIQGGYVSYTSGNIGSLGGVSYTDYIAISAGNKYKVSGISHTPDASGLVIYNTSKSYVSGHQYDANNSYSFIADTDGFMRCTVWDTITVTEEITAENEKRLSEVETKISDINKKYIYPKSEEIQMGKYVNLDGDLRDDPSSISAYRMDISEARGKKLYFNARVLSSYAVVLQNDELNRYLICFNGNTAPAYGITPQFYAQEISFVVPNDAKYLSFSYPSNNQLDLLGYYYDNHEEEKHSATISLFNKIGVIGDSYASGEIYITGSAKVEDSMAWGNIIAKMCGVDCTLYSRGGLSTRTWLTSPYGLQKLNSEEANNLYILALGINDAALGADYLGNASDMDEETKPDTFYGNYATIIEAVQTKSPLAKMVIMTFRPDGQMNTMRCNYNKAIRDIASHYGIPLVDLTANPFFNSYYYQNNMVNGHPVGVTYSGMAVEIRKMIEQVMVENALYFATYRTI